MTELRRRFFVVEGGGERHVSSPPDLALIPPPEAKYEQLLLGGWGETGSHGCLLSVGFDSLDFNSLRQILVSSGTRRLVDIRLLASFRGRGFTPDIVESTFRNLGIEYLRFHELANPFVGRSTNPHLVMQDYKTHLRERCAVILRRISAFLHQGPVLLLGRQATHFGSERELLAESLSDFHPAFEVIAFASCRGANVSASSYTLASNMAQTPDPAVPQKRRRLPNDSYQLSFLSPNEGRVR